MYSDHRVIIIFLYRIFIASPAALAVPFTFTTIDFPGSAWTEARGINDNGSIVGFYTDSGGLHGFLLSKGVFTTIDFAGALETEGANGVSNNGSIVGGYLGSNGFIEQGFVAFHNRSDR